MTGRTTGRIIGAALLVQIAAAPPVYFLILPRLTAPGALADAAAHAFPVQAALLGAFVLAAMSLLAAVMALPIVRPRSERMALAFVALAAAGIATMAMETLAARGMLALSLETAKAGAPLELLGTLGTLARSEWRTAHYTNLVVSHGTMLLFWVILFRFALIHRAIAGFGMAAGALSTTAVALPLLGLPFRFIYIMPLGMASLALVTWLLVRGLDDRPTPHVALPSARQHGT